MRSIPWAIVGLMLVLSRGANAYAQPTLSGNFAAWSFPPTTDIPGNPIGDAVYLPQANGSSGPIHTGYAQAGTFYFIDSACALGVACASSPGRNMYFYAASTPGGAAGLRLQSAGNASMRPDTSFELLLFKNHYEPVTRLQFMATGSSGLAISVPNANGTGTIASTVLGGRGFSIELGLQFGAAEVAISINGKLLGSGSLPAETTVGPTDALGIVLSYLNPKATGALVRLSTLAMAATSGCGGLDGGPCPFGDLRDRTIARVGQFRGGPQDELLIVSRKDAKTSYWLAGMANAQLRFTHAGDTTGFGGAELVSPFWTGQFSASGQTETLFWFPNDQNYWLGRVSGKTFSYTKAGNTAGFAGGEGRSLFWTGDFTGSGKTETLFWHPPDQNYWLGRFTGTSISYTKAGNTSGFGGGEGVSILRTGNFTGAGKTEILFWFPGDQNYWLGRFNGSNIGYTKAGNTAGFGGGEGRSLFWTGDFTGSGKTETLFWHPPDRNYWLGRFVGTSISYTQAGNTSGFGGAEGVSLLWTGTFTGSGKTEILFWFPGDQNYWLGRFTGNQIGYTLVGNTSAFGGAEQTARFWVGQFSGSGKTELLMWYPGDGNWWLGTVQNGQFTYQLVANTGTP